MDERDSPTKSLGAPSPATAPTANAVPDQGRLSGKIIDRAVGCAVDQQIGPYRILEKLGEGGMGAVYLAEQTEPVRRKVALKLIKPGMDTVSVLARFDAERQALAVMDHANIAKVLDAGTTRDGRPYFVMEHIRGVPITTHADRERLSLEERIDLFLQICAAVHHAHQKGIIHRDLKPSNVLVSYDADTTTVKVIDFGIAKAINHPLTEADMFTQQGHLVGTPEYMSPEQAEMSAQGIDTRADVYSLGVVLYELLSGTLPFDPHSLRSVALHEIHRVIREVEPSKPSTRLSTMSGDSEQSAAAISKARRSDPRSLSRRLRGDLDWIVMKCLEKDRNRRYDSVNALSDDLRRYVRNEPVTAGPPSAAYKVRKFVRRNRSGVIAAMMIVVALVAGLVAATWQWQRAEAARAAAEASDARSRGIAHSLINQFYADVTPLPGSSSIREAFVREATRLLEDMGPDPTPASLVDLADGYDRVGDVLGGLRTAHRGDLDGAWDLYARASDLRSTARAGMAAPTTQLLIGVAHSALSRGDILRETERLEDSIAAYREGLLTLEGIAPTDRKADAVIRERALLNVALANALARAGDQASEREALLTRSIDALRPVCEASPTRENRWALGRALTNRGELMVGKDGAEERALQDFEDASVQWRSLLASRPADSLVRHDSAGTEYWRATTLAALDRPDEALAAWAEAARLYGFLHEADPTDMRAVLGLARVHEAVGNAMRRTDPVRAHAEFESGIQLVRSLPTEQQGDPSVLRLLGSCQYYTSRALLESPTPDAGGAALMASDAYLTLDALDRIAPGDESFTRKRLADAAQVWLVALSRVDGARPHGASESDAARVFAVTIERWSPEGESKALERLRTLAAGLAGAH